MSSSILLDCREPFHQNVDSTRGKLPVSSRGVKRIVAIVTALSLTAASTSLVRGNFARRYPGRRLSDRAGAALHEPRDRRAQRRPRPDPCVSFPPARRGKGNHRADARRRDRSQSHQCGADRQLHAGNECARDAVPVSLHRTSAEGAGRADRQRNPQQLRALRICRADVLRFRRAFDLQQRAAGPHASTT